METFTPPATASPLSPLRMLSHARWIAVRDDEHMVSRVMLGPVKSNTYETRLEMEAYDDRGVIMFPFNASSAPMS